jgi:hypothetical protein
MCGYPFYLWNLWWESGSSCLRTWERIPDWQVFSLMHGYLLEKGEFPKPVIEHPV